jgi:lysophospholipase L1-like esterase
VSVGVRWIRSRPMGPTTFSYDNRTGRPPGRLLKLVGRAVPPVGRVQRQVDPYAVAWQTHNQNALTEPGRRWIVLGDSMSQGIGASAFDAGWVNQLHQRLDPATRPRILNLSANGARVLDVLEQQIPAYRSLPDAADLPDLVTVLIGSNDLFGRRMHRRGLPEAFAELLAQLPTGAVVATLPQPHAAAAGANAHIDRVASAGGLRVVDLRTAGPASWRGKLASDRFHPNDDGFRAIADAFEPVVRAALA